MGRVLGHVETAHRYAEHVVKGKVPACRYVQLAGQRFLNDLESGSRRGLHFNEAEANRICKFQELLPHVKGKWAKGGQLIHLEPWQKFGLCNQFGWQRENEDGDWVRRFRISYEEVPRKNAKSTKLAGVALYMLGPDEEEGAECVSAATTRHQAQAVWGVARRMVLKTPRYRERFGVEALKHAIIRESTGSNFIALSREADTLDGLNLHFGAVDELHAHKSRELWDVLDTAMGARSQPLLMAITTAGGNQDGICYELRDYLVKILEGTLEDDAFWGIIYTVDSAERWDAPEQWRIANPNYGISVDPAIIEQAARRAKHSASALNNFLTKHLNVWVNAASAFINMDEWKAGAVEELASFAVKALKDDLKHPATPSFGIPPEFDGRECLLGADLAARVDIASLAFIFPEDDGGATVFGRHYLPEELVKEAAASTGGNYAQWAKAGWLTLTPGNVIDLDHIESDVKRAARRFNVKSFAHDPWQAQQMVAHLAEESIECIEVKPMVSTFSPAMKEVEALVKAKKLRHNGDPCARWMVSNVVAKEDFKQNVYPRKEKPGRKIDFFVAMLEAMNRFVAAELVSSVSPYEQHGFRSL